MIENLRPLTQEQRQTAYQAAHQAAIRSLGSKPMREQFSAATISKYPISVTRLISALCLILLLAAFTPSAIRLYVIGYQTFGQAVPNKPAQVAVGLALLPLHLGNVVLDPRKRLLEFEIRRVVKRLAHHRGRWRGNCTLGHS